MSSLILPNERVMEILKRTGAYREGHFQHPSGVHSPHYFQMPLALRYSDNARVLAVSLSRKLRRCRELIASLPKVSVVAPGAGGLPVAFEVRSVFGAEQTFWAEREHGEIRFRQYSKVEPGEKCLIVDDILRSGSTVKQVHDMIVEAGGDVLAVGVIVRFSTAKLDLPDVPVYSLMDFEAKLYPTLEECPPELQALPAEPVRF